MPLDPEKENSASFGKDYENMPSLNQDLTFKAAKEYFYQNDIPFGKKYYKALKLQNDSGLYTNLAFLLSDQSLHIIRLAVFNEFEIFKFKREFTGSLLKQLHAVYDFMDKYNGTQAKVDGLIRIEKRDYPEETIREALINALIHNDYSLSGSILISIFDDRIEFASTGSLPKEASLDEILSDVFVSQNKNLAAILKRLQIMEGYKTNIPRLMQCYSNCIRKPELQVYDNAFKITLPNKNIDINKIYTDKVEKLHLAENEMIVMKLFKKKYEITKKDIESALSISQVMAARILRKLVDKKYIFIIGEKNNIRYRQVINRNKYFDIYL